MCYPVFLKCNRHFFVFTLLLCAGLASRATAAETLPLQKVTVSCDSLPDRLPCYHAFEKAVTLSACTVAASATGIEAGITEHIRQVAFLNRQFYICLGKHYPNGKK